MLEELGIGKTEQQEVELICDPVTVVDMAAESPTAEDLLNQNFQNSNFKNNNFDDNEGQDQAENEEEQM